jgi:hypothetical protein
MRRGDIVEKMGYFGYFSPKISKFQGKLSPKEGIYPQLTWGYPQK